MRRRQQRKSSLRHADVLRQGPMLVAGALSGLTRVRRRSSPQRLVSEAERFLDVLVSLGDPEADIGRIAGLEVRSGALAAASVREVREVCALWRQVLGPAFSTELRAEMTEALARLEEHLAQAASRWARERIDAVVICASAGGIRAVSELLDGLEPDLPASLVIVIHVPADATVRVPLLLSRSRFPVAHAVDRGRLFLGCAYLAPPAHHLTVTRQLLHLGTGPRVRFSRPSANVLFSSAACAFGARLASVVLTGAGTDGAEGTRAVHHGGGMTFAQDAASSDFTGMPHAASATGLVDYVLPLDRLASAVDHLVRRGRSAMKAHA